MDAWQSLEGWQKVLIGAIASCVITYGITYVRRSVGNVFTGFSYSNQPGLPRYVGAVSGNEIRITRPDGSADSIELSDLSRVLVITNDRGPWDYDVWFVLEGSKGTLVFPLETDGLNEVLALLKQLPGFELQGMNSAQNAQFECWPNPPR